MLNLFQHLLDSLVPTLERPPTGRTGGKDFKNRLQFNCSWVKSLTSIRDFA